GLLEGILGHVGEVPAEVGLEWAVYSRSAFRRERGSPAATSWQLGFWCYSSVACDRYVRRFLGSCYNLLIISRGGGKSCPGLQYLLGEEAMKKKPDLLIMLVLVLSAGLLISSVAQSSLL